MSLVPPALRDLALRLLQQETEPGDVAMAHASARVCGKVGVLLTKLAGAAGFRSLLARALVLAQEDAAWLKPVYVSRDGTLEGLEEARAGVEKEEVERGDMLVVAQLLGLLHAFIGASLTQEILREAWPGTSQQRKDPNTPPT